MGRVDTCAGPGAGGAGSAGNCRGDTAGGVTADGDAARSARGERAEREGAPRAELGRGLTGVELAGEPLLCQSSVTVGTATPFCRSASACARSASISFSEACARAGSGVATGGVRESFFLVFSVAALSAACHSSAPCGDTSGDGGPDASGDTASRARRGRSDLDSSLPASSLSRRRCSLWLRRSCTSTSLSGDAMLLFDLRVGSLSRSSLR